MPKGSIAQECTKCGGKVTGSNASQKYRKRCVFVHTYEDQDLTRWVDTQIFHDDECWATAEQELHQQGKVVVERDGKVLDLA